ncbi:hypothetical protein ABK040_008058 [Willaertia magna]
MSTSNNTVVLDENQLKEKWDQFSTIFQQHFERSTMITAQTMISMLGINNPSQQFEENQEEQKERIILDLGCGAGGGSFLIASQMKENDKLICMDISSKMLNLTKEKLNSFLNNNLNNKRFEFIEGSAEKLPFEDDSIDIIFSNYVLHLVSDPDNMIREVNRVLKKDSGMACFSVWGRSENSPKFTIPRRCLQECNNNSLKGGEEKEELNEEFKNKDFKGWTKIEELNNTTNLRSAFHLSNKEELKNKFKENGNFTKILNWYQIEPMYAVDAEEFAKINIYGNPQIVDLMKRKKFTEEHLNIYKNKIIENVKDLMEESPIYNEVLITLVRK